MNIDPWTAATAYNLVSRFAFHVFTLESDIKDNFSKLKSWRDERKSIDFHMTTVVRSTTARVPFLNKFSPRQSFVLHSSISFRTPKENKRVEFLLSFPFFMALKPKGSANLFSFCSRRVGEREGNPFKWVCKKKLGGEICLKEEIISPFALCLLLKLLLVFFANPAEFWFHFYAREKSWKFRRSWKRMFYEKQKLCTQKPFFPFWNTFSDIKI